MLALSWYLTVLGESAGKHHDVTCIAGCRRGGGFIRRFLTIVDTLDGNVIAELNRLPFKTNNDPRVYFARHTASCFPPSVKLPISCQSSSVALYTTPQRSKRTSKSPGKP